MEPIPDELLTERRRRVLGALVDKHIRTAQPVGSLTLVNEYRLAVSPATIRIEFGIMEELGLIYQPHRSAGRLPSDLGYRVFVDRILSPQVMRGHWTTVWERQLKACADDIVHLLSACCELLGQTTGYAGFAVLPKKEREKVQAVTFIPLPSRKVVVTLYGCRQIQKLFTAPTQLPAAQWEAASAWWTERLLGRSVGFLKTWSPGDDFVVATHQIPAIGLAYEFLKLIADQKEERLVLTSGVARVLSEPEFEEGERARRFLSFWDQSRLLANFFPDQWLQRSAVGETWVSIGSENPMEELRDCTLVAAPYRIGEAPGGVVGVIGPKRMRYYDALPKVACFAQLVSRTLTFSLS
ncbi:MAG: heat-inducible transcriptional repressor HrcA [Armatimonadetes bacterium]|nr:heat-inducible transcriptional repressor HrcA [Armatimonadota bacterium]MDW8122532.1 heat-inducible transcriptional repressor HrcA [Armatimonadota bacterium]